MQKISFNELVKIEQLIAKNNGRTSLGLQGRLAPQEQALLCMYRGYKYLFVRDAIEFVILTDNKIMFYNTLDDFNYKEIMLDARLVRAGADLGIVNLYYEGGYPQSEVLAKSIKSPKLSELLVGEINQAISQAKERVRAGAGDADSNNPINGVAADQLKKLSELHQAGILTDEEFAKAKSRVIGA